MRSEGELEYFDLSLSVQHWSGCWGGIVPKEQAENPRRFSYVQPEWLKAFLRNADPARMTVETVSHSKNGKCEELVGEYLVKVSLRAMPGKGRIAVVATCADGEPVFSRTKYSQLMTGSGLFAGYRLTPERGRCSLVYSYRNGPDGHYQHLSFAEPYGTIIASHLFYVENRLIGSVDLSSSAPTLTRVVVHKSL